jgi:hypothetical protein
MVDGWRHTPACCLPRPYNAVPGGGLHAAQAHNNQPAAPCSLYVSVITTIRGWGDLLWADVVTKIDGMGSQVGGGGGNVVAAAVWRQRRQRCCGSGVAAASWPAPAARASGTPSSPGSVSWWLQRLQGSSLACQRRCWQPAHACCCCRAG